jgi:hypothetical protein
VIRGLLVLVLAVTSALAALASGMAAGNCEDDR